MDTWNRYVKALDDLRELKRKTRPCVLLARRSGNSPASPDRCIDGLGLNSSDSPTRVR